MTRKKHVGVAIPTEFRFVDRFHQKYRISLRIPHKQEAIHFYCDMRLSLEALEKKIRERFLQEGVTPRDIDFLMDGWPERSDNRRYTKPRSDNSGGYLGVVGHANAKSFSYLAHYFKDGSQQRGKYYTVRLRQTSHPQHFEIGRKELEEAFAKACRDADSMRGKPPLTVSEYVDYFRLADYESLINRVRANKLSDTTPLTVKIT